MEKTKVLNILVVDDEKEICRLFTKWLSLEGHKVKSALTGKEAVNQIKREYYDFVFLNVVLPEISGIEVLEKIKKISPKTKVIMMTGKLIEKDLSDELKLKGASGTFQKPFKMDGVKAIINLK